MGSSGQCSEESADSASQTAYHKPGGAMPAKRTTIHAARNSSSPEVSQCFPAGNAGPLNCQPNRHPSENCANSNQNTSVSAPNTQPGLDLNAPVGSMAAIEFDPLSEQSLALPTRGMLPAPDAILGGLQTAECKVEQSVTDDALRPPPQPASTVKFSRRNAPYVCQVVECQRNLMKEKEYYRRYRVCKLHASQPVVRTCGEDRRYCQQCSVFHAKDDFDGAKRSCRARLNWHNNKRRKRGVDDGLATAAGADSGLPSLQSLKAEPAATAVLPSRSGVRRRQVTPTGTPSLPMPTASSSKPLPVVARQRLDCKIIAGTTLSLPSVPESLPSKDGIIQLTSAAAAIACSEIPAPVLKRGGSQGPIMAHQLASDNALCEKNPSQPSCHLYMGLSGTSARQVPSRQAAAHQAPVTLPLVAQHLSFPREYPIPLPWQGFQSWVPPPLLYMALQQAALVPSAGTNLRNPLLLDINLPSPDAMSVSDPAERAQLRRLTGGLDVPPLRPHINTLQTGVATPGDLINSQSRSQPLPWAVRLSSPAVPSMQQAPDVMNNTPPPRSSITTGSVLRPVPQSGIGGVALRLGVSKPHSMPSRVASPAAVNAQRRDWAAGAPPRESGHFSYPPRTTQLGMSTGQCPLQHYAAASAYSQQLQQQQQQAWQSAPGSTLQQMARAQHLAKLQEQGDAAARSELPDPRNSLSLVNVVRAALAARAQGSLDAEGGAENQHRSSAFRPYSIVAQEQKRTQFDSQAVPGRSLLYARAHEVSIRAEEVPVKLIDPTSTIG